MIIGRLLRPLRSGTDKLAGNDPRLSAPTTLEVSSPEFAHGATMPAAYRGTSGVNPPIRWSNLPPETREVVMIVEDVDVPMTAPLVHAILYAMLPTKNGIGAGDIPKLRRGNFDRIPGASLGKGAGFGPGWVPVTPIPGHGPHRYVFQVFALDTKLPLVAKPPSKKALLEAMAGHVIARGATVGTAEA